MSRNHVTSSTSSAKGTQYGLSTNHSFFLNTPGAILEKLRMESLQLLTDPPVDPAMHAYAILNCATTVWHLKDWTWNGIAKDARRRLILDELAETAIESLAEFEDLICTKKCIAICHQLVSAAKHVKVKNDGTSPGTVVEFVENPSYSRRERTIIEDENADYCAHEVMTDAYSFWQRLLSELQLTDPNQH